MPELTEDLRQLLRKAAAGVALSEEERAQLSALSGSPDSAHFSLDSDPNPARLTAADWQRWSALYDTEHRQLRRWKKAGEAKGKPCPLDDPEQMPGWWQACMRHSVPAKITAAAAKAKAERAAREKAAVPPAITPIPIAPPPPPVPETSAPSVVLANFDLEEGEAVRKHRQLVGALWSQLEQAYLGGASDIDVKEGKYLKALETLRKLETSDREARKQLGQLISRSDIERDLATAAEMLRQMRESMVRRVRELCPFLTPEQHEAVASAITRVRTAEDRVFAQLPTLANDIRQRAA